MKNRLGGSSFLFISTVLVNGGNYLLNLVLGRFLGPVIFAEVSVIATMVLMLSFVAVGVQLSSAKIAAESIDTDELSLGINWLKELVHKYSLLLALILLVLSPFLQSYLQFTSIVPIIIIALGLPFYFDMSLRRGYVQGMKAFKKLAFTYLIEMISRIVISVSLLYVALSYLESYATEVIALGFFASFFAASWIKLPVKKNLFVKYKLKEKYKSLSRFIGFILLYELSQILINNSDVVLAKHYFEASDAGMYAAVALIGRIVFFGTWTIVTLLFPKVIENERKGIPHIGLFWKSLGITAAFGITIILGSMLFSEQIMLLMFGSEYLVVSGLLWKYAVATSMFACANVFAYYYLSLEDYTPVGISLVFGALQLVLLSIYNDSLTVMVEVQILLMFCMLTSMIAFQIYKQVMPKKERTLPKNVQIIPFIEEG